MRTIAFIVSFLTIAACSMPDICQAQTATADEIAIDTNATAKKKFNIHSPSLAGISSAIVPGLGQCFNGKYWKLPIIYAGFAGAGTAIYFFNRDFVKYRNEYRYRLNGETGLIDPELSAYSDASIKSMMQYYQRFMEISIIVMVVWYAANIVDAVVDAHLFHFDISDKLSLRWQPGLQYNQFNYKTTLHPNIHLTFNF
ncbi:MAG: hypothetical protein IKS33_05720 [Bacteroidales bacterium]|nr:hypothetical protein [Bacteroidales bacterium]MBR4453738.1 hypothetical protein [Bacteroidales bacterium]